MIGGALEFPLPEECLKADDLVVSRFLPQQSMV